jgi:hypothetical protein
MPIEIKSSTPQNVVRAQASGVSPLTIAATIAFVILHLVSGVMLERSHASSTVEASALVKQLEPSLPYD